MVHVSAISLHAVHIGGRACLWLAEFLLSDATFLFGSRGALGVSCSAGSEECSVWGSGLASYSTSVGVADI
jgi:hypothetical protein